MDTEAITIRTAEIDDAQSITKVRIETWHATYAKILDSGFLASQTLEEGTTRLRAVLEQESQSTGQKPFRLVAIRNGEVVGFSVFRPKPDMPFQDEWFLHAIYIHPDAQGRRIGTKMVAAGRSEGKRRGATRMILSVFTANCAAQEFYRATGAEHLGPGEFEIGGQSYSIEYFAYSIE